MAGNHFVCAMEGYLKELVYSSITYADIEYYILFIIVKDILKCAFRIITYYMNQADNCQYLLRNGNY